MGNKDRLNHGGLTILSAKATTGAGTQVRCSGFKHVMVAVATDGGGTANFTLKCQGSLETTAPTWANAQSLTNHWDYIHMWDMQSATGIAGDTGLVVAGADDYRIFMVNTDGLEWINFNVTAISAGSVTVKARLFSNL